MFTCTQYSKMFCSGEYDWFTITSLSLQHTGFVHFVSYRHGHVSQWVCFKLTPDWLLVGNGHTRYLGLSLQEKHSLSMLVHPHGVLKWNRAIVNVINYPCVISLLQEGPLSVRTASLALHRLVAPADYCLGGSPKNSFYIWQFFMRNLLQVPMRVQEVVWCSWSTDKSKGVEVWGWLVYDHLPSAPSYLSMFKEFMSFIHQI